MRIWIFEDNLMWSSRLVQSLKGLGHEASVESQVPNTEAFAAIVNLGSPGTKHLVPELKERGVKVIAHAGHKEKELLELGRGLGVDKLATNSELTYKIESILAAL